MTRAPARSARATVSSVLPESTTRTSSAHVTEAIAASMCRASFLVMIVAVRGTGQVYRHIDISLYRYVDISMPMTSPEVLASYRESGALLDGHFKLSSGLHSASYLQSALVLQHPARAEALGRGLAARLSGLGATVVVSPAMGGLIIGHEVGRGLGVRAIFVERQDGTFSLRRGFSLDAADRVVVIEDIVTTGLSTREAMAAVTATGATVVGAGAIIDRSGGTARLEVPFHALASLSIATHEPGACPMCAAGLPVVKPGSRA
jgi:orotate phosphoribosyltransferase